MKEKELNEQCKKLNLSDEQLCNSFESLDLRKETIQKWTEYRLHQWCSA
ncbi:MAG: hypothetical protein K2O16_04985 [Lachnospiraceae bacterium]|nr:hypothetical protein [Lachnospiraceae bacterium]MDE7331583.1 hypothetical protein [Lachnospiraceae bacterium]